MAHLEQVVSQSQRSASHKKMKDVIMMHEDDWVRHQAPLGLGPKASRAQFRKMILPCSGYETGEEDGDTVLLVRAPTKIRVQDKVKKTVPKDSNKLALDRGAAMALMQAQTPLVDHAAVATNIGWIPRDMPRKFDHNISQFPEEFESAPGSDNEGDDWVVIHKVSPCACTHNGHPTSLG